MSRSITSVVRGRAINSSTQNRGRLSTYMSPVTHTRHPGAGTVARITMLNGNELGQSETVEINSTAETTLFVYTYMPALPTSKIIVDYTTRYTVTGNTSLESGADSFESRLTIQGARVANGFQQWLYAGDTAPGTGTRSGVLFPLMGAYNNVNNNGNVNNYNQNGVLPLTIIVRVKRGVGDDTAIINSSAHGTWLRITEVVA
jgi:hypothetical protein